MKIIVNLGLLFLVSSSFVRAQNDSWNMNLLGNWTDHSLPVYQGLIFNDVWGYTDPSGGEYGIIGSAQKVHFINITNPGAPVEVASFAGGVSSIWRDIKTYGNHAYSVADQGAEGLMIFDMSGLPGAVAKVYQSNSFFNRAHNIFIDEDHGRLYVFGSSGGSGNIMIFDIATDPENPILLGAPNLNGGYIHDAYVTDNIVYCSHGNNGLYVYDMTNPTSPVELGNLSGYLNNGYNHSSWLSEDGTTLVFCDESHGRKIKAIDATNLSNLSVSSNNMFYSNLLGTTPLNSIAHNPVVKGHYAYISYYHDGVQVFDITDRTNVTRVAYFDTYPDNTGYSGYDGNWGIYPLFDSGKIIASDDTYGLFILELSNPLPVGLKDFVVTRADAQSARIAWKTSHEENSAVFYVERSVDNQSFSTIGSVAAAGNSQMELKYFFYDEKPEPGTNYYRLRQVDFDGKANYSDSRSLSFWGPEAFSIFPTLAKAGTAIRFESKGILHGSDWTLQLFDVQGKLLKSLDFAPGETEKTIPTETFVPGTCLFVLKQGDRTAFLQKMIISE